MPLICNLLMYPSIFNILHHIYYFNILYFFQPSGFSISKTKVYKYRQFILFQCYYLPLLYFQRRQWQPTPVLLLSKSHGRRSLVGYSPWGRQELDMTEQLHFHFSLSCIGEGNGNRLLCSCLKNPRDGGAWWAAIYGVAQSRTRLKWFSSSSSSSYFIFLLQWLGPWIWGWRQVMIVRLCMFWP